MSQDKGSQVGVRLFCLFFIELISLLEQRIRIEGLRKDPWFRKNYVPVEHREDEEINLDDVCAVFDDIEVNLHSFVLLTDFFVPIVYFFFCKQYYCKLN